MMAAKPPAPSKGHSSSNNVPLVKPKCNIQPSAVIADRAQLTGSHTITIGEDVFVHPYAKIKAEHGNVQIGKGSILAEKAAIGTAEEEDGQAEIVIGEGVRIESGSVLAARKVGDHCTLGINCRVGRGAVLGKWCKIAPLCEIKQDEILPDYTVVFGEGQNGRRIDVAARDRREVREAKLKGLEMERELLKSILVSKTA